MLEAGDYAVPFACPALIREAPADWVVFSPPEPGITILHLVADSPKKFPVLNEVRLRKELGDSFPDIRIICLLRRMPPESWHMPAPSPASKVWTSWGVDSQGWIFRIYAGKRTSGTWIIHSSGIILRVFVPPDTRDHFREVLCFLKHWWNPEIKTKSREISVD